MARALNRLTAKEVASIKTPGRHGDGGGLYLRVMPAGGRSWVFIATRNGVRTEIGLGSTVSVSLALARRLAAQMRETMVTGGDPRAVLEPPKVETPAVPLFGAFAERYIASVEAGWKNLHHRRQWWTSIEQHAAALREVPVTDVTTDQVLAVLQPIWLTKAETARRLRGRIEKILDAAKALGHRPRESMNPAAWRGHLSLLLPSQAKVERGHHAALPWKQAPAFLVELRARPALAARCLEFIILTACRSGEALGATWAEINLDAGLWTVPAKRMKANAEHVVPLSSPVLALLTALQPAEPDPTAKVFAIRGATRSNMAIAMLLRRMGRTDITTHGFRSTFRDWAGDATTYPRELIEQALAHTIANKAERAYRRGTAIERRRELMAAWASYLDG